MIWSKLSASPSLSFLICAMGINDPNLSIHSSEAKDAKARRLRMAGTNKYWPPAPVDGGGGGSGPVGLPLDHVKGETESARDQPGASEPQAVLGYVCFFLPPQSTSHPVTTISTSL